MKKAGSISDQLYSRLKCSADRLPLLYALLKVHKSEVPLCPIACVLSALPNIPAVRTSSQAAVPPWWGTPFPFVEFIQPQVVQEGAVLASFNVVSLFTNVPMDLVLAVARQRLQDDSTLKVHTCLKVKEVMELLRFCLLATFFGFQGSVYRQMFGSAPSLCDNREPGDGGSGGESSCNSKCATQIWKPCMHMLMQNASSCNRV